MAVGIIGGPIGGPIGGVINIIGTTIVDADGSANIDFGVSGVGESIAESVGSANIDFAVSGVGASIANADGSANIDFAVSGTANSIAESVGSANIDFSVSGVGESIAESSAALNIDFNVQGVIEDANPIPTFPVPKPQETGGVGRHAWRDHYKKLPKKKRKLLEDLDEALIELRSRIEETPSPDPAVEWVKQLRRLENFVDHSARTRQFADEMAKAHLEAVKQLMREIDDEEATFLLLH